MTRSCQCKVNNSRTIRVFQSLGFHFVDPHRGIYSRFNKSAWNKAYYSTILLSQLSPSFFNHQVIYSLFGFLSSRNLATVLVENVRAYELAVSTPSSLSPVQSPNLEGTIAFSDKVLLAPSPSEPAKMVGCDAALSMTCNTLTSRRAPS